MGFASFCDDDDDDGGGDSDDDGGGDDVCFSNDRPFGFGGSCGGGGDNCIEDVCLTGDFGINWDDDDCLCSFCCGC